MKKMVIKKDICTTKNLLFENGYTMEEEAQMYNEDLEAVFADPRFFLDNVHVLTEYRVKWKRYNNNIATLPYEFVNKQKVYKQMTTYNI